MLEELRKGGTNAEIAIRIGIGPETVKTHISNMLAKLEMEDRHELAAWREEDEPRRLRWLWLLAPVPGKPLAVRLGQVAEARLLSVRQQGLDTGITVLLELDDSGPETSGAISELAGQVIAQRTTSLEEAYLALLSAA